VRWGRREESLAFVPTGLTLAIMGQLWFRKLFSGSPRNQPQETRRKAEDGDADSQFQFGRTFVSDSDARHDYTQAAHWYLKAANQNHALAQFTLGIMLAEGRGVVQDEREAMMWILRAAEQGHPGAQFRLGWSHRRASVKGGQKAALESNLEAYKWFRLAADQGFKGSEIQVESIALKLTREQVMEGNQRVAAFRAGRSASAQT